jgi:dolichol kinase
MNPFAYYISFIALAAVALALFAYWSFRSKQLRNLVPVAVTIVVSAVIALFAYTISLQISGLVISSVAVAAVSSMLPILYRRKPMAFMLVAFIVVYAAAVSFSRAATVGMFGVGTIIGMFAVERYLAPRREDRSMRKTKVEMERDMVQMVLGIAVLLILLIWQQNYVYILFWVMILAYLFNNLISRSGKAYKALGRFERRDVEFGRGAIHLAAGLAILIGFASFKLAVFGIFPLFFGDALATLNGMRFYKSKKLPHNRRKSVAGTFAFFIATVIPGALLLGLWGIPIAIVLTLVESIDLPIDDNISVPIVTIVLGALLGI